MSLFWKIKRRCLPAFQNTLIGFTLSIVLFILIHPQRTYKMPTVYDQANVDELGQKSLKVGQLSEKVGPNDTQDIVKDAEPEKDAINEEEKEMTDEERSKIDEEFKEGGDEEKEKNAESKYGSDRDSVNYVKHEENKIFDSEEEDDGTQTMGTKANWMDSEIAYNISRSSGRQKRLPQALVFGIKKCGTDILMDFLSVHPDLKPTKTEAHFFNKNDYAKGINYYGRKMPVSSPEEITLEKTPNHFEVKVVPSRVKKMNSTIKLILIARDPVKRLISDYVHNRSMKRREKRHTFEEMVFTDSNHTVINETYKPVYVSKYHIHLSRWLRYFPRNQILVLDGEQFTKDPVPGLQKVGKFLGVKPHISKDHFMFVKTKGPNGFYCKKYNGKPACMSGYKGRSHPYISESVLTRLYKFYKPHNTMFYNIVGKSYGWER